EEGGRGAGPAHALAFLGAVLVLVAALASPLHHLGEEHLFTAHMVQHILLGDVAPLLVLLSLSRVIMRPLTRRLRSVERTLGRLAHPAAFLAVWFGLVSLWHIPPLYVAAIEDPALHALEHASFFAAGIAVWWPLIQPVPMRTRLTGLAPFAYIGAAKGGLAVLGLSLLWSNTAFYAPYTEAPGAWGLSPVEDQNVGGALMMVEQSIVLVLVLAVLFVRMLAQSEREQRRRERLEDAATA
ncbi:MAG: cytochrome c oxidase assembly protein, partial [Actinomycetota bacterium]|nr:cytochrome c oxidase assembly protein [Actinomycetota bacterium]